MRTTTTVPDASASTYTKETRRLQDHRRHSDFIIPNPMGFNGQTIILGLLKRRLHITTGLLVPKVFGSSMFEVMRVVFDSYRRSRSGYSLLDCRRMPDHFPPANNNFRLSGGSGRKSKCESHAKSDPANTGSCPGRGERGILASPLCSCSQTTSLNYLYAQVRIIQPVDDAVTKQRYLGLACFARRGCFWLSLETDPAS